MLYAHTYPFDRIATMILNLFSMHFWKRYLSSLRLSFSQSVPPWLASRVLVVHYLALVSFGNNVNEKNKNTMCQGIFPFDSLSTFWLYGCKKHFVILTLHGPEIHKLKIQNEIQNEKEFLVAWIYIFLTQSDLYRFLCPSFITVS